MYKRRLIPVLFLKDGWMVRSEGFVEHQFIGHPVSHVRRMVTWDVDELIVLNISKEESSFDTKRTDFKYEPVTSLLDFITLIAGECRIPLTFGGLIRSVEDVRIRIQKGADKIAINTLLFDNPKCVEEAARSFGQQAIVASIDYRMVEGEPIVFTERGKRNTKCNVVEWARHAENSGAGEILLNSIDKDGMASGYDINIIESVARSVCIPLVACGGAGVYGHFLKGFENTSSSALAAGNIFHFKENAYPNAKRFLKSKIEDIRFNT